MRVLARAGEQVGLGGGEVEEEEEPLDLVGERDEIGGREGEVEAWTRVKESWEDSEEEELWRERRRRTRETRPVLLERRAEGRGGPERCEWRVEREVKKRVQLTRLLSSIVVAGRIGLRREDLLRRDLRRSRLLGHLNLRLRRAEGKRKKNQTTFFERMMKERSFQRLTFSKILYFNSSGLGNPSFPSLPTKGSSKNLCPRISFNVFTNASCCSTQQ